MQELSENKSYDHSEIRELYVIPDNSSEAYCLELIRDSIIVSAEASDSFKELRLSDREEVSVGLYDVDKTPENVDSQASFFCRTA